MAQKSLLIQRIHYNVYYGISFSCSQNRIRKLELAPVHYAYTRTDHKMLKCLLRTAEKLYMNNQTYKYEAPKIKNGWCEQPNPLNCVGRWSVLHLNGDSVKTAKPVLENGRRLFYFPCFKFYQEYQFSYDTQYPDTNLITYPLFYRDRSCPSLSKF